MTRTPAVASNRRTWTWSAWIKRGKLETNRLFSCAASTSFETTIYFDSDRLGFVSYIGAEDLRLLTTQVFRDPAAWYHIVIAFDTTQATASNRVKIYVNGSQVTAFGTATYPIQNYQATVNSVTGHFFSTFDTSFYYDGYIADVNFVDGQALTPSYFGATNPATGVWQPNQYKGNYGTNGYYLPMNIEVLQKSFTKSLRFRASATAFLNRTPASAGNRKTWTWSAWVKRGSLGRKIFFSAGVNSGAFTEIAFLFTVSDTLSITAANVGDAATTAVFRDPSAWYHIVLAFDTTQADAANRAKYYVNGVLQSWASNPFMAQNSDYPVNNTVIQKIGTRGGNEDPFDGYLTEINFIDGLALTPNYFGQTDTTSGAWQPVGYTGLYGTNGFYLPFTNTTSVAALGFDASGRNNNWTVNNISLTAGSTYDSMTDVPTLTSATEANYCVLNPLYASATLSNGNLTCASNGTQSGTAGSMSLLSNKYYYELSVTGGGFTHYGIIQQSPTQAMLATTANSDSVAYKQDGSIFRNTGSGFSVVQTVASYTTGDVVAVAIDTINNTIQYYKNNTAVGTPISLTSTVEYTPWVTFGLTSCVANLNFGQQPFTYTPPTGFVALNAYNM
jgi:hypothetical protein